MRNPFRNDSKKPDFRTIPPDAIVFDDDMDSRSIVCPRCGRPGGLFYAGSFYEPGTVVNVYRCHNQFFGGEWCDQKAYSKVFRPEIVWASENGMWAISLTDRGFEAYADILCEGDFVNCATLFGDGKLMWDSDNGPDYVLRKAESILVGLRQDRGMSQDYERFRVVTDVRDANGKQVESGESEEFMYFEDARRLQEHEWEKIPDVYKPYSAVHIVNYHPSIHGMTSNLYNTYRGRRGAGR